MFAKVPCHHAGVCVKGGIHMCVFLDDLAELIYDEEHPV